MVGGGSDLAGGLSNMLVPSDGVMDECLLFSTVEPAGEVEMTRKGRY